MHIVILSPSWPRHGAANGIVTYCDSLIESLRLQGHDVTILAINRAANVDGANEKKVGVIYVDQYSPNFIEKIICRTGEIFSSGFAHYYLGGKSIVSGIKKIEQQKKIDVLETEESFGWHYFLQRRVTFPVVMRLHGPHYINGAIGKKAFTSADIQRLKREERAFRTARYVNAPSQWVLNDVQKKYGIKWPVQAMFFNPLKVQPVDQCWSLSSYTPNQLLFVGRFDTLKGGDFVIKAFAKVIDSEPTATLVFAGLDGGVELACGKKIFIEDAIQAYMPEGKRDSVRYIGLADKQTIGRLRRESHVTLMASKSETLGYAVLESLASAAPIVAPYVAGICETFEDGVSGVSFEGGNSEDMAEKIITLLRDPLKTQSLSQSAYKRCQSVFSPSSIAQEASHFYSRVIESHKKDSGILPKSVSAADTTGEPLL